MDKVEAKERARRIAELNDEFRRGAFSESGVPQEDTVGEVLLTSGIAALPVEDLERTFAAVRDFAVFEVGNDPWGEHDFGAFDVGGNKVFWKIDYYDKDRAMGSPDPADPAVTTRVLTIMLAEEY